MKRKIIAILLIAAMAMTMTACAEDKETTISGMVVSVEGTVISLMEMDKNMLNMGGRDFGNGERPEMPEGMEGFEGFNPENFDGTMPTGENFPQWGEGEMSEDMTPPEGMTMPENGQMPNFGGEGGMRPGMGNFSENMETQEIDLADAHISVEIEDGKESGSMDNIVPGAFVTVTLNGKGQATYVLVSARSGFGGGRMPWGNQG